MAHDESDQQVEQELGTEASRPESFDRVTVSTSDSVIDSAVEHTSDWKTHPDTTVRVETTQISEPSPLYVPGVAT